MKVQFEYGFVTKPWPEGGWLFSDSDLVLDDGRLSDIELLRLYKEYGIQPVKDWLAEYHRVDPSCITIKAIGEDGVWREVYQ